MDFVFPNFAVWGCSMTRSFIQSITSKLSILWEQIVTIYNSRHEYSNKVKAWGTLY